MAVSGGMAGGVAASHSDGTGTTLTVDPATDGNTSGEYASVQYAVDNSSEGDHIEITPGTYEEAVEVNTSDVSLLSATEGEDVTIDASDLEGNALTINGDNVNVSDDVLVVNSAGGGSGTTDDSGALIDSLPDELTAKYFGIPLIALLLVGGSAFYLYRESNM